MDYLWIILHNYGLFITKLTDVIDYLCPSKKIRIKGNAKPWFYS